jgi:hypothetical protein
MRLKTIWSIPSMSTMERFRRTVDWGAMTTASKLPKRIRYWATVLEIAKATRGEQRHVMGVPLQDILKNLEGGPK